MEETSDPRLAQRRVALLGRLSGLSPCEAQDLIRACGGIPVAAPEDGADLVVLGIDDGPSPQADAWIERLAALDPLPEFWTETQFLERLDAPQAARETGGSYTAAMLAELLRVPVATIRRWQRWGLIRPVRQVKRLSYFDFQEVAAARWWAQLLSSGVSSRLLRKQLTALARHAPPGQRALVDLGVVLEGRRLLLRRGENLIDAAGQLHFDFDTQPAVIAPNPPSSEILSAEPSGGGRVLNHEELAHLAAELEDRGQLVEAAECYRAALAAAGPDAELNFLLAEVLYRLGDLPAARERYFAAIEIDEDFVEARANLGCLLAECGQSELAVAALRGALAHHPQYADAHYHLARLLDELGQPGEAETHWRAFLEQSPDSPWAETARRRLNC